MRRDRVGAGDEMDIEADRLFEMARDRGPIARGRLLTLLTGLVLGDVGHASRERDIFFDIVRDLIEHVPQADRERLSQIAADLEHFPRDLLMRLAGDDIAVAEPVLARAAGFVEDDLIDLATRCGDGHRAAIAVRRVVSRRLSRVLVRLGDGEVLRRLGANRGAEFSDDDIHALHLRSENDPLLRDVLHARDDLRDAFLRVLRRMMERAVGDVRPRSRGLSARGDLHPVRAVAAAPTAEETEGHAAHGDKDEDLGVAVLVEHVRRGTRTVDAVVVELADADRHADLARFLGTMADIDETGVLRVLVRSDVDGIALLAGGLAIAEAAFERLIELRRRKLRFPATQVKWEREAYRKLDRENARATLDQLGRHRRSVA